MYTVSEKCFAIGRKGRKVNRVMEADNKMNEGRKGKERREWNNGNLLPDF